MAQPAVEFLVRHIEALLKDELSLLGGAQTNFNEIKRELEFMKSFLKDADNMRNTTDGFKTWVEAVRDATYDVQDVMDKFTWCHGKQRTKGFLAKGIHLPKYLYDKHNIATKLQEVRVKLVSISEKAKQYGFDHVNEEGSTSTYTNPGSLQHRGESPLFSKDDEIVGIDKQREVLLEWLLEDEQQRTVISMHGMGGSGKTTLAAKVYQSQIVKRNFDCFAWITVSQTYEIKDLFRSMITQFYRSKNKNLPRNLNTAEYSQLVEALVEFLKPKRYVIVLDDVWDVNLLTAINVALQNEGRGSRIMLTTRNKEIARASSTIGGHVHQLQPLKDEVAWALFCKKAFSVLPTPYSRCCPPDLQAVAIRIVKKCEGLPLAILAMGGMMSSKGTTELEWEEVYKSLKWEIENNRSLQPMMSILLLSYNELPSYLKPCFLFCCIFPEDHVIHRNKLIQLWVAEGFVEERSGMTLEQVADTYLRELISRSLLQVEWREGSGIPHHCLIHDLMRELALSKSEKENFCVVYENSKDGEARNNSRGPRRLSTRKGVDASILSCVKVSRLRSFYMFLEKSTSTSLSAPCSEGSLLPPGFRLLRVLDLQGIPITSLPDELVDLFNLRYLNISKTKVRKLPKSIGRLRNLQTLDITYSNVEALPNGIVKLKNLRNLLMRRPLANGDGLAYEVVDAYQVPVDICNLTNLQELQFIEANGDMIRLVGQMTQLRKFGVTKVTEAQTNDLCSTIQNLILLRALLVVMINEDELLNLDGISSPPPFLQELVMLGKLEKVPLWFPSLKHLSLLYLHWSKLGEDLLIHIQALPCLGHLILVNAYHGQQLCFLNKWFPKLGVLRLKNFPHLNMMKIENGAMPNLEKLILDSCNELKTIPDGIEHLSNLQWLNLENMPEEFITRLCEEGSIDHIPRIDHTTNGWYFQILSNDKKSGGVKGGIQNLVYSVGQRKEDKGDCNYIVEID